MRNHLWIAILGGLFMLLAGCHGGSSNADPLNNGLTPDPIPDPRPAPSDDPTTAVIEGRVALEGLTLRNGINGVSAISQITEERILVRLLDPTEDILIASLNPDLGGRFTIMVEKPLANTRLEVEFEVMEDINGNNLSDDIVNQAVPLALEEGQVAMIDMKVFRSLPEDVNPGIADVLLPDEGFMLLVELKVQDASGYHEDYYGVNYQDNSVVYDTDGDRALEEFDDFTGVDINNDGWADQFAQLFAEPTEPEITLLTGYVTSVNQELSEITILQADDSLVTLIVDPFIAIEELNLIAGDGSGQFFGPVPLDTALIGQYVQIEARQAPAGYLARWIVVIEPPEK